MRLELQETLKRQRGNSPTPLEWLVVIYVIGFIWEETEEIFGEGIRNYLRNMWNFIDFSRNSLYCMVFVLRGIAYVQQMNQISQDPRTAFIPREQWDDFDPQLIVSNESTLIMRFCSRSIFYPLTGRRTFCCCKYLLSIKACTFVLYKSPSR